MIRFSIQNGTIAGNLMIKHAHPEFPSDIFMLLETIGATLSIGETLGGIRSLCFHPTLSVFDSIWD